MSTPPATKKTSIWVIIIACLCGICGLCIVISYSGDAISSLQTSFLPPEAQFEKAIERTLGTSNRDVKRLNALQYSASSSQLIIKWAVNDNLSNDMIKRGAMLDIEHVLKYISQNDVPYPYQEVLFYGSFPLVDTLGNSSEEQVVFASYKLATIQAINWDNFLTDNIFVIANSVNLHPAITAP